MGKANNYIDNEKFFQNLVEYVESLQECSDDEQTIPVPDYIGECFLLIATNLAFRKNFINYTYRDDMVGDAIENCLQCVGNFDKEKSKNPFAYFTQVCYFAFLRRIQKEKKEALIKEKVMNDTQIFEKIMEIDGIAFHIL